VLQKFEETFKLVLNVKSTKECMNILLLTYGVFKLWQSVFLEWERCNILDGFGDVPTRLPKLIGKYVFGCLANLKEKPFEKPVRGLPSKIITLGERP
jgi:hypothetical protein